MKSADPLILLATGGTGGHIFPAESVASLLEADTRLLLLRDRRGKAFTGVLATLQSIEIMAAGVTGKAKGALAKALLAMAVGLLQSMWVMLRHRPALVVGFGGYASVPVVLAAQIFRIPTLIHEQNALLGRANRMLAPRASRILTSFPTTQALDRDHQSKIVCCGNPVRRAFTEYDPTYTPPSDSGPVRILVTGGSQGSAIFAKIIPQALKKLSPALCARLVINQQTRPEHMEDLQIFYDRLGVKAHIQTFFSDLPELLHAAHLAIVRAGASTIAELGVMVRPAILIPYAHATDDHQRLNAERWCDQGCGWLMPEDNLTPALLAQRLEHLITSPLVLETAALRALRFGQPKASERMVEVIRSCLKT